MTAHYGCFEDESVVIDMCPPCSVSHATYLSFEVEHLFSGQSGILDLKVTACLLFLTPMFSYSENSCHALVRTIVLQQTIWAIAFWGFVLYGPMIHIQELLLPRQVAYSDTPAFHPPIQYAGHDSHGVLLVFLPSLHVSSWVLPLHHHPLWHVTKRPGNKVGG